MPLSTIFVHRLVPSQRIMSCDGKPQKCRQCAASTLCTNIGILCRDYTIGYDVRGQAWCGAISTHRQLVVQTHNSFYRHNEPWVATASRKSVGSVPHLLCARISNGILYRHYNGIVSTQYAVRPCHEQQVMFERKCFRCDGTPRRAMRRISLPQPLYV